MSEKPKPTTTDNTTWHTPMSEDEIDAEIQAHRREKRANPVPQEVEEIDRLLFDYGIRIEANLGNQWVQNSLHTKATAAIQAKITEARIDQVHQDFLDMLSELQVDESVLIEWRDNRLANLTEDK